MAKSSQIKKLVNGEFADADDVNQAVEDAGTEGGLIPYDPTSHEKSVDGSQSLGSTANPWGSLKINQDAELVEVDPASHTEGATVTIKNLRKFNYLKDAPASYSGQAGKYVRVKSAENGLEFITPPTEASAGDILEASADTERSTTSDSYTKLKEIQLPRFGGGTYRIKFDIKKSGDEGYARIYRNGVAVGTERSATVTYVTHSEDISGWSAGDLCQLYVKKAGGATAYVQNFRIYSANELDFLVNTD